MVISYTTKINLMYKTGEKESQLDEKSKAVLFDCTLSSESFDKIIQSGAHLNDSVDKLIDLLYTLNNQVTYFFTLYLL